MKTTKIRKALTVWFLKVRVESSTELSLYRSSSHNCQNCGAVEEVSGGSVASIYRELAVRATLTGRVVGHLVDCGSWTLSTSVSVVRLSTGSKTDSYTGKGDCLSFPAVVL
jgi:hypothetical protein